MIFDIVERLALFLNLEIAMQVGDFADAETMAGPDDMAMAQRLGSDDEFPEVWATSRMILLMEIAATRRQTVYLYHRGVRWRWQSGRGRSYPGNYFHGTLARRGGGAD